jgi:hypothetical protein
MSTQLVHELNKRVSDVDIALEYSQQDLCYHLAVRVTNVPKPFPVVRETFARIPHPSDLLLLIEQMRLGALGQGKDGFYA